VGLTDPQEQSCCNSTSRRPWSPSHHRAVAGRAPFYPRQRSVCTAPARPFSRRRAPENTNTGPHPRNTPSRMPQLEARPHVCLKSALDRTRCSHPASARWVAAAACVARAAARRAVPQGTPTMPDQRQTRAVRIGQQRDADQDRQWANASSLRPRPPRLSPLSL